MRRFSISEFSTYRWSLDKEVGEFKNREIQSLGIWRTKFSDSDIEAATDLLYSNSMHVSSISWAGGFTGSCGMSHEDAIDDAKSAIRTAARIGADCLVVHSGCRNGHTRGHAQRLLTTALDRLIPVAADYGVRLALELMQATEREAAPWTIADTFDETIEMVLRYAPTHVGLVLDLFHIGREMTLMESLDDLKSRIVLVQLADRKTDKCGIAERCLLGNGELPVMTWFDRLEKAGYEGMYEIELHGPLLEDTSYRQRMDHSLAFWKRLRNRVFTAH